MLWAHVASTAICTNNNRAGLGNQARSYLPKCASKSIRETGTEGRDESAGSSPSDGRRSAAWREPKETSAADSARTSRCSVGGRDVDVEAKHQRRRRLIGLDPERDKYANGNVRSVLGVYLLGDDSGHHLELNDLVTFSFILVWFACPCRNCRTQQQCQVPRGFLCMGGGAVREKAEAEAEAEVEVEVGIAPLTWPTACRPLGHCTRRSKSGEKISSTMRDMPSRNTPPASTPSSPTKLI